MAKVYATVYPRRPRSKPLGDITAGSIKDLRAKIVFRLNHPKRFYSLDAEDLVFYVFGQSNGMMLYKHGSILWMDQGGYYHKVNADGTIG